VGTGIAVAGGLVLILAIEAISTGLCLIRVKATDISLFCAETNIRMQFSIKKATHFIAGEFVLKLQKIKRVAKLWQERISFSIISVVCAHDSLKNHYLSIFLF
jgi:hypothetical protein